MVIPASRSRLRQKHSKRYLRIRATVRTAWMLAVLPLAYMVSVIA